MARKPKSKSKPPAPQLANRVITIHYGKCEGFRTIHVDGVIGGITPPGYLHMALFSERLPIPLEVDTEITSEGKLGQEVVSRGKTGAYRELQIDAMLDLDTARALHRWLGENIKLIDNDPRVTVSVQKVTLKKQGQQ